MLFEILEKYGQTNCGTDRKTEREEEEKQKRNTFQFQILNTGKNGKIFYKYN